MFNDRQKQQFLTTIDSENSHKSYVTAFNKSESFETSLNKDVADMTLQEIILLLDMTAGKSAQSIANYRSLLANYVDWYIREGKSVFSENNISKISYTVVDKQQSFRPSYVGSEEELKEMIEVAFPHDYSYNQEIFEDRETIIWLIWLGFERDEIRFLKKNDIDYENGIIKSPLHKDIIYKVEPRILEMLKRISETTEIEFAVEGRNPRVEKLCINDYVYRPKVGKFRPIDYDGTVGEGYAWKRCAQLNTAYEEATGIYKNLTIKTLPKSKWFIDYYNAGETEDFIEAYKTDLRLREPNKNERQIYMAGLNFKRDYEVWKKVFR